MLRVLFGLFALPILLVAADGKTGNGTTFKKCSGSSSLTTASPKLCFKVKIDQIVVKIGNVGTDDDVTMTICSDHKTDNCCTTPALSSLLSDDWSKNDEETWKGRSLGKCKDTIYEVNNKLLVTLSKSNKGALEVKSIDVYMKNADAKVTEVEQFGCGSYSIGGSKLSSNTKQCLTTPYHYMVVEKLIVQMGNDGTDDNVKVKIASDINNVACERKLSHLLSDDWKRSKLETWLKSDFGNCKSVPFKVKNAPTFSITKDGKDNLKVTATTFYMRQLDNEKTTKYECGGFNLTGNCRAGQNCRHTFSNCRASIVGSGGRAQSRRPSTTRRTTTTKRPTTTTTPKKKGGILSSLLG